MLRTLLGTRRRFATILVTVLAALGATADYARACVFTCTSYYGWFIVDGGQIHPYIGCTTYYSGGHTYITCYYGSN